MAEPAKKDDALAAAVREAFQRHMENARLSSAVKKPAPLSADPKFSPKVALVTDEAQGGLPALETAQPRSIEQRRPVERVAAPEPAPSLPRTESAPPLTPAEEMPNAPIERPAGRNHATIVENHADEAPRAMRDVTPSRRAQQQQPNMQAQARPAAGLAPPAAANDREQRRQAERQREVDRLAALAPPAGQEAPQRSAPTGKARQVPGQGQRPRQGGRREPANVNVQPGAHFGRGSRTEAPPTRKRSGLVKALFGLLVVAAVCAGVGGYVWVSTGGGDLKAITGSITGAITATPAPKPAEQVKATGPQSSVAPAAVSETPEDPVQARSVKTVAISLDAIDLAVQDSRERMVAGDVAAARLILERFRDSNDARALFALAETFDPSIARGEFADAREAQALYEAAGRAGAPASADRIAKLQLPRN